MAKGGKMSSATLKELQKQNENLKKILVENAPYIEFARNIAKNEYESMEMADAAKILNIPGMDGRKLYAFLRKKGILTQKNHPYQRYIDREYFCVVVQNNPTTYGTHTIAKTLVLPKGLIFLHDLLKCKQEQEYHDTQVNEEKDIITVLQEAGCMFP